MASLQISRRGKNCLVVAKNALEDIKNGQVAIAVANLHALQEDSIFLAKEAKKFAIRLEKVEEYYISEEEKIKVKIGELGCEEDELKKQQNDEERSLASHRRILTDNQNSLSSAKDRLRDAERKLERAKKDEEERVRDGAITGAVVGFLFFGVGAIIGAGVGAGIGAIVNACVDDVEDAKAQICRREADLNRARSEVRQSESRVSTIQSKVRTLNSRIESLKKDRQDQHKKVDEIKDGICFLKRSVEFWQLFKVASEHGENRTSVLQKILEIANKTEDFNARSLQSRGTQKVRKTFLDAWEDLETMSMDGSSHIFKMKFTCNTCYQSFMALPHVTDTGRLACDRCVIKNACIIL